MLLMPPFISCPQVEILINGYCTVRRKDVILHSQMFNKKRNVYEKEIFIVLFGCWCRAFRLLYAG